MAGFHFDCDQMDSAVRWAESGPHDVALAGHCGRREGLFSYQPASSPGIRLTYRDQSGVKLQLPVHGDQVVVAVGDAGLQFSDRLKCDLLSAVEFAISQQAVANVPGCPGCSENIVSILGSSISSI